MVSDLIMVNLCWQFAGAAIVIVELRGETLDGPVREQTGRHIRIFNRAKGTYVS